MVDGSFEVFLFDQGKRIKELLLLLGQKQHVCWLGEFSLQFIDQALLLNQTYKLIDCLSHLGDVDSGSGGLESVESRKHFLSVHVGC